MSADNLSSSGITEHLGSYRDPLIIGDMVAAGMVGSVEQTDGQWQIALRLGFPLKRGLPEFVQRLEDSLQAAFPGEHFAITAQSRISAHVSAAKAAPVDNVKNIIAVASGKGGVGKSTTTVNLALALMQEGATVGILDADIYGPSQPIMLGAAEARPDSKDRKSIEPVERFGLQSMSIGYLINPDQATVWRGPMVSGALQQLLTDTNWRALDYLLVDMPPGTGDIQLTLAQKVPVTGALIVTTPQDIALADARRAIAMFAKVSIPVLGVVENMATHVCTKCGHEEAIFGHGGGALLADQHKVELLGSLPLALSIREQTDSGSPSVVAEPDGEIAERYRQLARQMTARLAFEKRDAKASFPKITIENT